MPLGLEQEFSFSVCLEDGFCKVLSAHTRIRGEGRLDVKIEGERRLLVNVAAGDDGAAIGGAQVLIDGPRSAMLFENGDVSWSKPHGGEGVALVTGVDGSARFLDPNEGSQTVRARAKGYSNTRMNLTMPPRGDLRAMLALGRESARQGNWFELHYEDGVPVTGAFLLAIGPDGRRERQCDSVTNHLGRITSGPSCSTVEQLVVLHSGSEIMAFDSPQVNPTGLARRASRPPIRLRLVDADGLPIPSATVRLQYHDFAVDANDVLAAIGAGTSVPFYLTNERGELLLRGVDPESDDIPSIRAATRGLQAEGSLEGLVRGETLMLEASPVKERD